MYNGKYRKRKQYYNKLLKELIDMKKGGYSRPGLFGTVNHYDASGHKVGESRPGLFGGFNTYDNSGHQTSHSDLGFFGGFNHYKK